MLLLLFEHLMIYPKGRSQGPSQMSMIVQAICQVNKSPGKRVSECTSLPYCRHHILSHAHNIFLAFEGGFSLLNPQLPCHLQSNITMLSLNLNMKEVHDYFPRSTISLTPFHKHINLENIGHLKIIITVIAEPTGFSRCTASGKSLNPESCLDNQSNRSFRPSAPSLASISAAAT